jgi:hypothetical protein
MVETPAAVQIIKDLVKEGIDFISFGTNDLTQYMLAVDRGNERVQHLYNEMHPAILYQLGYVIRVCKREGVETSICGQAGSRKPMAKYLVEQGIDSISVNADMAEEIAKHIAEVESELVKGTDKEPRQYQPEENKENPPQNQGVQSTEEAVKSIEKEKQEYEKAHPEEAEPNGNENEESEEEIQEVPPFNPEEDEEVPEINGAMPSNNSNPNPGPEDEEKEQEQEIVKDVNEAVEAIEEEKEDYIENNPKEYENEPVPEETKEEIIQDIEGNDKVPEEVAEKEEEIAEETEKTQETQKMQEEENQEDEVLDIF